MLVASTHNACTRHYDSSTFNLNFGNKCLTPCKISGENPAEAERVTECVVMPASLKIAFKEWWLSLEPFSLCNGAISACSPWKFSFSVGMLKAYDIVLIFLQLCSILILCSFTTLTG